jgi:hypothetical protein
MQCAGALNTEVKWINLGIKNVSGRRYQGGTGDNSARWASMSSPMFVLAFQFIEAPLHPSDCFVKQDNPSSGFKFGG